MTPAEAPHASPCGKRNRGGVTMAASNEWTEWHLTPRGWEEGSGRLDGVGVTHAEPPTDRVPHISVSRGAQLDAFRTGR